MASDSHQGRDRDGGSANQSFGIGGEIEIRSGLLTQKQLIQSPVLHFGLGDRAGVEFARIVWPNGIIQAEFALQQDQSVLAQQRLKGSCPLLFSWDGKQMQFLKGCGPMSAPGAHTMPTRWRLSRKPSSGSRSAVTNSRRGKVTTTFA